MSYDPSSIDAMFSRILQRMDNQDAVLQRIDTRSERVDERVTSLETWKNVVTSKVTLLATLVSGGVGLLGWAINLYFARH